MKNLVFAIALLAGFIQQLAAQTTTDYPSVINVTGYAERWVEADEFSATLTFSESYDDEYYYYDTPSHPSKEEKNEFNQAVQKALNRLGVKNKVKDLSEMNGYLYDIYSDYNAAYYSIEFDDVEGYNKLMKKVQSFNEEDEIVVSLSMLESSVSDEKLPAINMELEAEAAANAKLRAENICKAMGLTLGKPVRISLYDNSYGDDYWYDYEYDYGYDYMTETEDGKVKYKQTVNVEFRID